MGFGIGEECRYTPDMVYMPMSVYDGIDWFVCSLPDCLNGFATKTIAQRQINHHYTVVGIYYTCVADAQPHNV
jgi:hypothetical protein